MFERHQGGDLAVLLYVTTKESQEPLAEFVELVDSAGVAIADIQTAKLTKLNSRLLVGSGKAEALADAVQLYKADVIIVNQSLSPSQERNLEKLCQCRVIDRVTLILDIFAQRARSFEGKLQVELAQLRHLSTRLIRGWTHLERQKGGIGLRGPGEKQLETDRRLVRERMRHIRKRLEKVEQQRELGRKARQRADIPVVALVGYTNAGKSTLFNRLVGEDIYVADQLFATLDPTLRLCHVDDKQEFILADTVGFVHDLPHELVAAFRATLQETQQADLLLHVIDSSDEHYQDKIAQVDDVLAMIEAAEIPTILVYNKIDQMSVAMDTRCDIDEDGLPKAIWISAQSGDGCETLKQAIIKTIQQQHLQWSLLLPATAGKLIAALYRQARVTDELPQEDGSLRLTIDIEPIAWNKLIKSFPELPQMAEPQ